MSMQVQTMGGRLGTKELLLRQLCDKLDLPAATADAIEDAVLAGQGRPQDVAGRGRNRRPSAGR